MVGHQCLRCRSALRQATCIRRTLTTCRRQAYSSTTTPANEPTTPTSNNSKTPSTTKTKLDIAVLLSKPTWSVRSLLPRDNNPSNTTTSSPQGETITPSQLHHLLRLSALPQPSSPAEEATMLRTLSTQLHFVRAIQAVDTTGVEPLVTLRDETPEGIQELTAGLDNPSIKEALGEERKVGRMGRVRRIRGNGKGEEKGVDDRRSAEERQWDPLRGAQGRTEGRYFVVESGRVGGGSGAGADSQAEVPKEKETREA